MISLILERYTDYFENAINSQVQIVIIIFSYEIQQLLFFLFSFKMSKVEIQLNFVGGGNEIENNQKILKKLYRIGNWVRAITIFYIVQNLFATTLHGMTGYYTEFEPESPNF